VEREREEESEREKKRGRQRERRRERERGKEKKLTSFSPLPYFFPSSLLFPSLKNRSNLLRTTGGQVAILDWGLVQEIPPHTSLALVEYIAHLR
jgi:hypothetical protein